jgi:hypothetical protein
MTEMQLLTRFRAEVPLREPSSRAEHLLLTECQLAQPAPVAAPRRKPAGGMGTRARVHRLAIAGGLGVVLGAGLLAGQALPAGDAPAVASAADLARHAAAAAAARPAYRAGQWFYEQLESDMPRLPAAAYGAPSRNWTVQYWRTAGPSGGFMVREAWLDQGRLRFTGFRAWPPGMITYRELRALPADPQALINALAVRPGPVLLLGPWFNRTKFASSPETLRVFWSIASILTSFIPAPRQAAELYTALGMLPGLRVDHGATDIAGRPGVAFELVIGRTRLELILNPHDFGFMGLSYVSPASRDVQGFAVLRQVPVSGPGVRP